MAHVLCACLVHRPPWRPAGQEVRGAGNQSVGSQIAVAHQQILGLVSADPALQPRPGGRDTLATKLAFLRYVPWRKAISPSPAAVPAALLAKVAETLSPEAQIELVVWISIQQMLHRLERFLDA